MNKDEEDKDFDLLESSGSCKISEITGFTFGGQNSRFWMLRKHINSLNKK